jgi:hypothetical protein
MERFVFFVNLSLVEFIASLVHTAIFTYRCGVSISRLGNSISGMEVSKNAGAPSRSVY